jgi:hypothetical protein
LLNHGFWCHSLHATFKDFVGKGIGDNSTACPGLICPTSTSGTFARISRPLAIAIIEVEVAEAVLEADVVGATNAPSVAYFCVTIPENGAVMTVSLQLNFSRLHLSFSRLNSRFELV